MRKFLLVVAVLVLAVSGFLTGSRTPLALVIVSGGLLAIIKAARSSILALQTIAWLTSSIAVVLLAVGISSATSRQLTALTEGRWDLWTVAWAKFSERPLVGYGFDSWRDDLAKRSPREYEGSTQIENLSAGGYHNQYLTLLAEQGLVGFIPAMALLINMFLRCFRLGRSFLLPRSVGWACLLCTLLLALRAIVEVPGLFGGAEAPPDYLAYCFLAILATHESNDERVMIERPVIAPLAQMVPGQMAPAPEIVL